jgi:hypothetical protein
MWKAKKEYIFVTGTRSHSGIDYQNFEGVLSELVDLQQYRQTGAGIKTSVRRKLKTKINDWFYFEARHFIGRSIIPHGRSTSHKRSQMWNVMNAALKSREEEETADWPHLLAFGHTHYYDYSENAWGGSVILPCWKAAGDVYGDEIMDGHIDLGVFKLIVGPEEDQWGFAKRIYNASVVSRVESR